jgi:predicted N-acyltransferase
MQWLDSADQIKNDLEPDDYPFLSKGFLTALEQSNSINGNTGWNGHYLIDSSDDAASDFQSIANKSEKQEYDLLIPAFIKHHSYGEYVFDWAWAEAYQKHGLNYYPKLLIAAPFTPSEGPRLFGKKPIDGKKISQKIQAHCIEKNLSSAHILLCNDEERLLLQDHNWHLRSSVQFHWYNYNYTSFEDFLSRFKSRKRKTVKKERALITANNIHISRIEGKDITPQQLEFFYYCYQTTYAKRRSQGYLNLESFKNMQENMADQMFLVIAHQNNEPVACALYFKDDRNLYGRYWGCAKEIDGLHFEVCYYQGIEYCIENNIQHFDPGTQGEHKISRGFEPIFRYSLHYLQHEGFHEAVGDFVKEERKSLEIYQKDCYQHLPFNQEHLPPLKN